MIKPNDTKVDFKYLLVREQDKQFGLWVNTVGYQPVHLGELYPPTGHPSNYYFSAAKGRILHDYQLLYIIKGEGHFCSDHTKQVKIEEGSLIMLFPGQWHTYWPSEQTGWTEYYIGFEGLIIDNIIQTGFFSKENPVMEIGFSENLVNLFNRAIEIAKDDKVSAQQYLAGVVLHIIGKVLSMSRNKAFDDGRISEKMEHTKIIMNENIYGTIDLEEISRELNMGYSWFRKMFKEYTGYAPASYFQELKINKAKRLLTESSKSAKEIAYLLNYNSTEHFFSLFKKRTGLTPTAYRNYAQGDKDDAEQTGQD